MESQGLSPLVDDLLGIVPQAASLYHRLVLLVAPTSRDVHTLVVQAQERTDWPLLNVSLELSQRLQEVPVSRRPLRVMPFLDGMVEEMGGEVIMLDRLALLFEPSLQQNPLVLLKQLSRNRTLVAGWAGRVDGGTLIYAEPNHTEYRRFDVSDLLLVHAAVPQ